MTVFRRAVAIAGLVATGCGGDGGCRFEDQSIIVLHAVAPEVDEDSCVYDPDGGVVLLRGALDVAWGTPYFLAPVVLNNLDTSTREGSNTGVEDGDIRLESPVDVRLNLPRDVADRMGPGRDGEELPLTYPVPIATVTLPPESTYAAGMDVIPAEYSQALAAAITPGDEIQASVEIVFHATRTSNTRGNLGLIDSPPFEFPITLVRGQFVASCDCNVSRECLPGTEAPALVCGNAQDVVAVTMCNPEEPEEEGASTSGASEPPADASSSGF